MKRSTWIGIGLVILLLGVLCMACCLAGILLIRPDLLSSAWPGAAGGRMLLSVPVGGGESDLVLVRAGQSPERGAVVAEGARRGVGSVETWQDGRTIWLGSPEYGGFTDRDSLLLHPGIDGEVQLIRVGGGRATPEVIFESDSGRVLAHLIRDGDEFVVVDDYGPESGVCYLVQAGREVRRVTHGGQCQVSADGSTLLVTQTSSGLTDLTVMSVDGGDEVRLLEGEAEVQSVRLADDGSRIAYVRGTEASGFSLTVLSRDGSVLLESGTFFAIASYGFSPSGGSFYYIAEGDLGDLELHTLEGRVTSASTLEAAFPWDGENLVYLAADQGGAGTIHLYSLSDGSSRELARGDSLGFALLPSSAGILVREGARDDLRLWIMPSVDTEPERVFDEVGYYLQTTQVIPETGMVYFIIQEGRGALTLYAASLETGEGDFLLEGWTEIQLLNVSSAGRLLLSGREDPHDPVGLFVLDVGERAEPVALDEDLESVQAAVFDARERQVWYGVATGPALEDVEIRRVDADGDRPAEVAYPQAALVDVAWEDLRPFASSYLHFMAGVAATSYCPGSAALQLETPFEDELSAGDENCYRFHAADELEYTVRVLADQPDLDTRLYLYDRRGLLIAEDDDGGPGLNPRLWLALDEPGLYFVQVRGYNTEDAGAYSIELREGLGNLGFPSAERIDFDSVVQGGITAQDEIYLRDMNWTVFGRMYTFEAGEQAWIEFDVDPETRAGAGGIGLMLFDPTHIQIGYGVAGQAGPDLQALLPVSGQYYILVGLFDETVPSQEIFFDVSLVQGETPEPGGGPISYGETREGYVIAPQGDEWTFEGEQGDEITITMHSSAIDSVMTLLAPDGRELRYDDDGAGYPDAMIFGYRLLESGTYTIVSRSLGGNPGPYALTLERGAPGGGGEITRREPVQGDLQGNSRDRWTFQGESGEQITILMTSNQFDTYLELYGPDGQLLTANDDAGSTSRSEISNFILPVSGEYQIVARAFFGDVGGAYTLELR